MLSHQQVEIINELEEKSTEIRAAEAVDYKKQDRVNESKTAVHASGGKDMYICIEGYMASRRRSETSRETPMRFGYEIR